MPKAPSRLQKSVQWYTHIFQFFFLFDAFSPFFTPNCLLNPLILVKSIFYSHFNSSFQLSLIIWSLAKATNLDIIFHASPRSDKISLILFVFVQVNRTNSRDRLNLDKSLKVYQIFFFSRKFYISILIFFFGNRSSRWVS